MWICIYFMGGLVFDNSFVSAPSPPLPGVQLASFIQGWRELRRVGEGRQPDGERER